MEGYTCIICDNAFTSSRRKKIECKNCEKICCLTCFKDYLVKSENITPKCMFCSENISYSFIRENCSVSFCNKELHEKRTETELNRQISLLPATQHLANLEIERRKYFAEIDLYDKRIEELKKEILIIQRQKQHVPYPTLENIDREANKITFIQKCPIETCNGFLNSSWKCGICETYICNKCHTPKEFRNDANHVCNEQTVANISAIKKDSKPCPKCATYIFKIDGCDQMWCPECKTAFSWKTGKIESGSIHNPHYFEFVRSINSGILPRQPGDILPCDVIPDFHTLWLSLNNWRRKNPNQTYDVGNLVTNFNRYRTHFGRIEIFRVNRNYQDIYTSLRVAYLIKNINKDTLKSKISKTLKKEERDSQILEIYNLYYNVTGEILKNVNELLINNSSSFSIVKEIEGSKKVKKFCNEKLKILSKQFKNNIRLIKN